MTKQLYLSICRLLKCLVKFRRRELLSYVGLPPPHPRPNRIPTRRSLDARPRGRTAVLLNGFSRGHCSIWPPIRQITFTNRFLQQLSPIRLAFGILTFMSPRTRCRAMGILDQLPCPRVFTGSPQDPINRYCSKLSGARDVTMASVLTRTNGFGPH